MQLHLEIAEKQTSAVEVWFSTVDSQMPNAMLDYFWMPLLTLLASLEPQLSCPALMA